MSQENQQLPPDPVSTHSAEWDRKYPHSDRDDTTHAAHIPTTAAVIETMQTPGRLTLVDRWATHASDSQFNALSGAIGGFTSGIVTCPLDVIKTKLQAQGGLAAADKSGHTRVYKGLVGTARVIWAEEGIRGMYRGLGPIIMGYLPTWAVWFTVYNKSKIWLGQNHGRASPRRRDNKQLT